MILTITGPRSVGKSTTSKLLSKMLKLKYISSDELGENALKKHGGLDKAIKSGAINQFIKNKGYNIILNEYKKDNFVFDLSVGSFTSKKFKRASRQVRTCAKKNSTVIGLLPFRRDKSSIKLLFSREIKRKHFKNTNQEILLKKTSDKYPVQKEILLKNCDLIVYAGKSSPKKIVEEIISKLNKVEKLKT